MTNNIVIATVGNNSCHQNWIASKNFKNFDLCLIYYGNVKDKYYTDADFYIEQKGFKYPLLYDALQSPGASCYDYFWFPDDDINASTADVNLMFEMMKQSKYYIAQPSLKKECPHTWPHTTTRPNNVSRETKFVEIMCPIFTSDALEHFLPIFKESKSGWGLDLYWSDRTLKMGEKLGILDIVSVEHQRKMGSGDLYNVLKKAKIDYKKEYKEFLKLHNLVHVKQSEKNKWE